MTWKVHWEDVIVMASRKTRGSMYSLTGTKRRGSQLVNIALPLLSIVVLTWAFEISHFHFWVWKIFNAIFFSKLYSIGTLGEKVGSKGLVKEIFKFNCTAMNLIFMHRRVNLFLHKKNKGIRWGWHLQAGTIGLFFYMRMLFLDYLLWWQYESCWRCRQDCLHSNCNL